MTRLLDGIRVIDAANFIAGPVSTTMMADFGADVIKVEPPTGDVYRVRGAGYPASPYNYPWIVDNRTKRSVAIDLRTEDGQKLLHRLVGEVDGLVTNAPLDSPGRRRVRCEPLAPLSARRIYASISAYGETGEEASKPGFDSIALWARTGLMDLVRASPDVPPARSPPGLGGHPTRHGSPPPRHAPLRGHHGVPLPSRAHGARRHGGHVADGQRALDERHPG